MKAVTLSLTVLLLLCSCASVGDTPQLVAVAQGEAVRVSQYYLLADGRSIGIEFQHSFIAGKREIQVTRLLIGHEDFLPRILPNKAFTALALHDAKTLVLMRDTTGVARLVGEGIYSGVWVRVSPDQKSVEIGETVFDSEGRNFPVVKTCTFTSDSPEVAIKEKMGDLEIKTIIGNWGRLQMLRPWESYSSTISGIWFQGKSVTLTRTYRCERTESETCELAVKESIDGNEVRTVEDASGRLRVLPENESLTDSWEAVDSAGKVVKFDRTIACKRAPTGRLELVTSDSVEGKAIKTVVESDGALHILP